MSTATDNAQKSYYKELFDDGIQLLRDLSYTHERPKRLDAIDTKRMEVLIYGRQYTQLIGFLVITCGPCRLTLALARLLYLCYSHVKPILADLAYCCLTTQGRRLLPLKDTLNESTTLFPEPWTAVALDEDYGFVAFAADSRHEYCVSRDLQVEYDSIEDDENALEQLKHFDTLLEFAFLSVQTANLWREAFIRQFPLLDTHRSEK